MNKGKRYAELAKLVDRSVLYDPSEAAKLVCETGKAKFDETVELHVRLLTPDTLTSRSEVL